MALSLKVCGPGDRCDETSFADHAAALAEYSARIRALEAAGFQPEGDEQVEYGSAWSQGLRRGVERVHVALHVHPD